MKDHIKGQSIYRICQYFNELRTIFASCNHSQIKEDRTYLSVAWNDLLPKFLLLVSVAMILPIIYVGFEEIKKVTKCILCRKSKRLDNFYDTFIQILRKSIVKLKIR